MPGTCFGGIILRSRVTKLADTHTGLQEMSNNINTDDIKYKSDTSSAKAFNSSENSLHQRKKLRGRKIARSTIPGTRFGAANLRITINRLLYMISRSSPSTTRVKRTNEWEVYKSRQRRDYSQLIQTTRLVYNLQDSAAHLSRLQRILFYTLRLQFTSQLPTIPVWSRCPSAEVQAEAYVNTVTCR
jgi:hypothetical protein